MSEEMVNAEGPVEPEEEQWHGLARSIIHAWDAGLMLKRQESSQWLRDEPEMQNLDHVPSKGTRCVIIYKAMLTAAKEGE